MNVKKTLTLEDYLSEYAKYHRDKRNIYTHYVGIPLIVFSVFCLLSKPSIVVSLPVIGEFAASPALVVWFLANLFYLKLDLKLGGVMTVITGFMLYAAVPIAAFDTGLWLAISVGIFLGGWVLQFIGHYYEGKKPAFVDDIMGLAIGPLFVLAEVSFDLGSRQALQQEIAMRVGTVKTH